MGALSATQYKTEFAGADAVVCAVVTGGTQTGTVLITGLTTVRVAQVSLAGAPTANASLIAATIANNIVTVRQYTPQGTLCTQTAIDFNLTVVGEY